MAHCQPSIQNKLNKTNTELTSPTTIYTTIQNLKADLSYTYFRTVLSGLISVTVGFSLYMKLKGVFHVLFVAVHMNARVWPSSKLLKLVRGSVKHVTSLLVLQITLIRIMHSFFTHIM